MTPRLKQFVKQVSSIFQTLKITGGRENQYDIKGAHEDHRKSVLSRTQHVQLSRVLSASDGNLNLRSRGPVHNIQSTKTKNSLNSKSTSDVSKLVTHVIQEATGKVNTSSLLIRQPIRIINGSKPSLQSQVLLNTKTTQPFDDLLVDLAKSVRIPNGPIGNRLLTVSGRQITSYSQLRSELKAGQRAFYVYSNPHKESIFLRTSTSRVNDGYDSFSRNIKPLVKATLGKVNSNSSSDLSDVAENTRRDRRHIHSRRRSHTPILSPHVKSSFSSAYQYSTTSALIPQYPDTDKRI